MFFTLTRNSSVTLSTSSIQKKVRPHREFTLSAVDVARPTWIVWTTAVRLLSLYLSPSVVQRAQLPGNNPQLFGE
jgi:hypothetical protein